MKFIIRTLFFWGLSSVFIIMTIAATLRAYFYDLLTNSSAVGADPVVDTQAILITKLVVIAVSFVIAVAISSWIDYNSYKIREPW